MPFVFRLGLFVQKVNSFYGLSASARYPVLISCTLRYCIPFTFLIHGQNHTSRNYL